MRTTVSIDDDLLRQAKTVAAAEGRTLSDLVSEGLRERLAPLAARHPKPFVPVTVKGNGIRPGLDINDNAALLDFMDRN
jgi:hypothetical protein